MVDVWLRHVLRVGDIRGCRLVLRSAAICPSPSVLLTCAAARRKQSRPPAPASIEGFGVDGLKGDGVKDRLDDGREAVRKMAAQDRAGFAGP